MLELILFVFGGSCLALGLIGYKLSKSARKAKMKQDLEIYNEIKRGKFEF